jgi:hypothetical protein
MLFLNAISFAVPTMHFHPLLFVCHYPLYSYPFTSLCMEACESVSVYSITAALYSE